MLYFQTEERIFYIFTDKYANCLAFLYGFSIVLFSPQICQWPMGGPQSQSHGPHRTNHSQRRGGSPPLGLAKWFGSDVLQQPLPSMPSTKVISVDELEFHQ